MTSCAKTLLPNLVAFYLNSGGRHDTKVLDRELLKTVRDYAPMAPAKLLASFAKGCMRRVKDKNGSVFVEGKRNALVCNLLTAIAKHAPPKVLTMMMAVVRAWLSSEEPVLVKQAHKLIEEVASRVDQQDLWSFFNENRDFATDLVMHKAKDSIPMDFRLRIYHWIFFAVKDYSKTCEYVQYACRDIILCLDHSNSRSVRKLAEECFDAVCRRIVSFGMDPQ
ncbi:Protein Y46E12BL.2 [Aphelenchoides avenae]|nr:Protein Y46E12BL.2 [Aphelenchus avenae]